MSLLSPRQTLMSLMSPRQTLMSLLSPKHTLMSKSTIICMNQVCMFIKVKDQRFFFIKLSYSCHYHILDNLNTDCIIFLSHFITVLTNAEKNSKYTFMCVVCLEHWLYSNYVINKATKLSICNFRVWSSHGDWIPRFILPCSVL
jgi:hypothetical protein